MSDPLREPTFLILTALADGPLHGYGLIAEVDRLTSGGEAALRAETERMRRHVNAATARLRALDGSAAGYA
jgi:hypothetical protein